MARRDSSVSKTTVDFLFAGRPRFLFAKPERKLCESMGLVLSEGLTEEGIEQAVSMTGSAEFDGSLGTTLWENIAEHR
jgi:hypothetical protein